MVELRQYISESGHNLFEKWFTRLDGMTQARVLKILDRLEAGNFSSAKGEGKGIFAARLDFGPGYRVYFGKDGELLVILLAGGSKKRQQADIEAAQALWQEYKKRKRDE